MPDIPIKTRRRILLYADKVATLAAEAPDITTRKEMWSVVQSIRKRFGFTMDQKQIEIWNALIIGAQTINDIVQETKFHVDDIHKITKAFEGAKLVEFRKIAPGSNGGRPMIIIVPIAENNSFSPLKLN